MSAVGSSSHPLATPEHRRQDTPDIIDVDALDTTEVVYVGSAHSQRPRMGEDESAVPVAREVIHVTDSEDDNEIQFLGHNPARPQHPPVRRERIFSPPPPQELGVIPPVPRIPQRFLGLRPRPPPGLIIPSEDPLPFEADLRPPPPAEQSFPIVAPPSHHRPTMGFGGAFVRQFIGPQNTSQLPERRNGWGVSGSFIVRWDPFDFVGGEGNDLLDGLDEIGFLADEDNTFGAGGIRSQIEQTFKHRDRQDQAEPDYKPEYTHPDPPPPGFTYDFSSSPTTGEDETSARPAGSSGARCEVTLICAACRDPLFLGASDVGQDRAKRKLWGLRCGHLLDGKCIQKLMEPAPPTPSPDGSSSAGIVTETSPSSSQDMTDSDAGSIRSRLRPRRGMLGSLPSASHSLPAPSSGGRRVVPARSQTTQRGNRKGKGKMKAPVVEAEHEWSCPVSGCGRIHFSLLMDDRWTMDEKRGAIAVFV